MEITHHVTVRRAQGFQFVAEFEDMPEKPSILFDEPAPLGENRAPNAAAVLGAAVGDCLAASLTFCLRKVRLDPEHLTAHVATHIQRKKHGRFRITGIDVELNPEFAEDDGPAFDRCERLFEDFCIVTEGVRHGIPVNVSVKRDVATQAA
jgi:organic hydroperoxide reductase OsmC/OhrA